jgi:hypothetical protein
MAHAVELRDCHSFIQEKTITNSRKGYGAGLILRQSDHRGKLLRRDGAELGALLSSLSRGRILPTRLEEWLDGDKAGSANGGFAAWLGKQPVFKRVKNKQEMRKYFYCILLIGLLPGMV